MKKAQTGDIFKIDIDDEFHTYARAIDELNFSFYDARSTSMDRELNDIINSPILFTCMVNNRGIAEGEWEYIGNEPLDFKPDLNYYLTDITDPDHFRISENGIIREAKKQECIGLEVHAIWSDIHIKQRLRDHYEGKENIALKMLDTLGNYKLKK